MIAYRLTAGYGWRVRGRAAVVFTNMIRKVGIVNEKRECFTDQRYHSVRCYWDTVVRSSPVPTGAMGWQVGAASKTASPVRQPLPKLTANPIGLHDLTQVA